jgi:hypothetical protein
VCVLIRSFKSLFSDEVRWIQSCAMYTFCTVWYFKRAESGIARPFGARGDSAQFPPLTEVTNYNNGTFPITWLNNLKFSEGRKSNYFPHTCGPSVLKRLASCLDDDFSLVDRLKPILSCVFTTQGCLLLQFEPTNAHSFINLTVTL